MGPAGGTRNELLQKLLSDVAEVTERQGQVRAASLFNFIITTPPAVLTFLTCRVASFARSSVITSPPLPHHLFSPRLR